MKNSSIDEAGSASRVGFSQDQENGNSQSSRASAFLHGVGRLFSQIAQSCGLNSAASSVHPIQEFPWQTGGGVDSLQGNSFAESPEKIAELVSLFEVQDAEKPCGPKEKIYLAKYFVDKVKGYLPSLSSADFDRAALDSGFFNQKIKPKLEALHKEHAGVDSEESKTICNNVKFVLDNFYEVHQATNRDLTIAFLWNTVVDNREHVDQKISLDKIYMLHSITYDAAILKTRARAEQFKDFLLNHVAECSQDGWNLDSMIENYPVELDLLQSGTGIEVAQGKVDGVAGRYLPLEGNGRVAAMRLGFKMAQDALGSGSFNLKFPTVNVTSYLVPADAKQSTIDAIQIIMDKTRQLNTQGYKKTDTILFTF